MNIKIILIAVVIFIIGLIGGFFYLQSEITSKPQKETDSEKNEQKTKEVSRKPLTIKEKKEILKELDVNRKPITNKEREERLKILESL